MVFSSGYDTDNSPGSFYHRMSFGRKYPRSAKTKGYESGWKDPSSASFSEDIWDFDDSWFASTRTRTRLDFFGELLWELVRLQSLLDYLLRPSPPPVFTSRTFHRRAMSPGDDFRRSRKRTDTHNKPRARSTHGPAPRATFDDVEDDSFLNVKDYGHRHRRHHHRDSSGARLSRDGDNISRASAPAASDDGKEESSKGWRTLTKELRKLLSSKFNDKNEHEHDHEDESSATDSSPRFSRKSNGGNPEPKPPTPSYSTKISVTKFNSRNHEPRVVREIPIRRLHSPEKRSSEESHSHHRHHSTGATRAHSMNDRPADWRSENKTSYPQYSKPPQPQRATMHFAPDRDPFLFPGFTTSFSSPSMANHHAGSSPGRARSPRPSSSSFNHHHHHHHHQNFGSPNSFGARVIFHPIFQTGRPHSTSFASSSFYNSRNPKPEDDDGLPPVIITEITEEEAEEITRRQQRERQRVGEEARQARMNASKREQTGRGHAGWEHSREHAKPEERKNEESPPKLRCEICFGSLRIGSGDDMALSCDHLFHSKCILEWLGRKSTCPVCHVLIIKD